MADCAETGSAVEAAAENPGDRSAVRKLLLRLEVRFDQHARSGISETLTVDGTNDRRSTPSQPRIFVRNSCNRLAAVPMSFFC